MEESRHRQISQAREPSRSSERAARSFERKHDMGARVCPRICAALPRPALFAPAELSHHLGVRMTDKLPQGLVTIHVHLHQHEGEGRQALPLVPPAYSTREIDVGWYVAHDLDQSANVGGVVVIKGESEGAMIEHWYLASNYVSPSADKVVRLKFSYIGPVPKPFDGFAHRDEHYPNARYVVATCEDQQRRNTRSPLPDADTNSTKKGPSQDGGR